MSEIGKEVAWIWLKQAKSIGRIINKEEFMYEEMVLILLNEYGKKIVPGWKIDEYSSKVRKKYAGKYGEAPNNVFYWLSRSDCRILKPKLFLDNE